MRIFVLLIACALLYSTASAHVQPCAFNKNHNNEGSSRDLALEKAALTERQKIDGILPVWAKAKLNRVFKSFLTRVLHDKKPINVSQIVKEELAREFPKLTPQQSNILRFYIVAGVIRLIPPHAERSDLNSGKDSLGEMSEMDMLMLQKLMEKKGQLEIMISNVMKAGYEGGQAAIQALKAS